MKGSVLYLLLRNYVRAPRALIFQLELIYEICSGNCRQCFDVIDLP